MFQEIGNRVKTGFRRFYITLPLLTLFFVYAVYVSRTRPYASVGDMPMRLLLALFFTLVFSLFLHGWDERGRRKLPVLAMLGINLLIFGCCLAYALLRDFHGQLWYILSGRWAVMTFTVLILFVSMPYMRRKGLGRHLWDVFRNATISLLFSFVLFLGLAFIALTLNGLFGLEEQPLFINEYEYLMMFSFLLVMPTSFLLLYPDPRRTRALADLDAEEGAGALGDRTQAAETGSAAAEAAGSVVNPGGRNWAVEGARSSVAEDQESRKYGFVSSVVLFYILMPLLIVYTLVLYVYFLKLAITFEFPNNVLANLVIWYLFVTHAAVYMISGISGYRNDFERWIIEKSRVGLPALLLPVLMMFVSIFLRIHAYGFTQARYLLLVFAVFNAVGLTLLYFYRWRAQFTVIVLAIVLLHTSLYGYFSVDKVTYRSQMARLEEKLAAQGYTLEDFYSEDGGGDFDPEEAESIASGAEKLLGARKWRGDEPELRALVAIEEASYLNSYMYSVKTRAYVDEASGAEAPPYYSVYNGDEVIRLGDGEYLTGIHQDGFREIEDLFVIQSDYDRIAVYDREGYYAHVSQSDSGVADALLQKAELCSFRFDRETVRAMQNEDEPQMVFSRSFSWGDERYEARFVIKEVYWHMGKDGLPLDDGSCYYLVDVWILRVGSGGSGRDWASGLARCAGCFRVPIATFK